MAGYKQFEEDLHEKITTKDKINQQTQIIENLKKENKLLYVMLGSVLGCAGLGRLEDVVSKELMQKLYSYL